MPHAEVVGRHRLSRTKHCWIRFLCAGLIGTAPVAELRATAAGGAVKRCKRSQV